MTDDDATAKPLLISEEEAFGLSRYRKAAEKGVAEAQYNLGFMYGEGEGVPQNFAEAVKWYRKAAEQGMAGAQFSLGLMYRNGQGVPRDYARAAKWYRKAAEQGFTIAQYSLGLMYYDGEGVPQDDAQAHMWYNLAASRFSPGENRDQAVKDRDIVAKRMTPAQISEAQKLAREWRPKK